MRRTAFQRAFGLALAATLVGWDCSIVGGNGLVGGRASAPVSLTVCRQSSWACGSVVKIAAGTGARVWQVETDGAVNSVVADRHGGAFIAGGFRHVAGRVRPYVAHILADGRLDLDWRPRVWSRRSPRFTQATLALSRRHLFVAGLLRSPTAPHPHILAVDARTGVVDRVWGRGTWLVDGAAGMTVAAGRLYVAGTLVRGESVFACLTAMGTAAGLIDRAFRPRIAAVGDLGCAATVAVRRKTAYVGGTFTSVDGRRANGLGAVDAATGRVIASWRPRLGRCSACVRAALVYDLAVRGRRVYAALSARRVDGEPRHGLVRLDARSAQLDAWAPRLAGLSANPQALVVVGDRVYIGGDFLRVNGTPRRELAALDVRTGRVLPSWRPRASSVVLALSAAAGNVFVATVAPRP